MNGRPEPPEPADVVTPITYRLLTGSDDHAFCERVSRALAEGYVLYGSPGIALGPDGPVVCQAVVLPD